MIYSDTGFPVGRLGPLITGDKGEKLERPLISNRYGLVGRPDYLIQTEDGIIPVEMKSAKCPSSGRPFDSHLMQLAAYCLLVEEFLGAEVPYGILRYRDSEVRVDYAPELREELIHLLDEMRAARRSADVHRSHSDVRRCSNCQMRDICDEAL